MMLFEQAVKERFFRRTPHLHELQGLQIAQRSTQRTLLHPYVSGPCAFRDAIPHHAFYGRQLDLACAVKQQQQSRGGRRRSAHFRKLGLSTSSARAVASIPSRWANSAAAAHSSSGSRARTACVPRHSANRRCNCSTSSRCAADSCATPSGPPALGIPYQLSRTAVTHACRKLTDDLLFG